jgi:hypothetical protein
LEGSVNGVAKDLGVQVLLVKNVAGTESHRSNSDCGLEVTTYQDEGNPVVGMEDPR